MHKLTFAAAAAAAIFAATGLMPGSSAYACASPDEGCKGLSAEELRRDRAEIRRLNREQLRYVERRDAEYARGWDARRQHQDDLAQYDRERAEYERRMAAWREAVRRCQAGDYRYCDR